MDKLIAVGMRYCKDSGALVDGAKVKTVTLQTEKNSNGVEGYAVKVLYKDKHVAYIRNKDLPELFKTSPKLLDTSLVCYGYQITQSYTNYLVLTKSNNNFSECKVSDMESLRKDSMAALYANRPLASQINTPAYPSSTKEPKMNISTNMRDAFFREVKNVAIDIQSGKFGVTSTEGISVYVDGGVSVNPITDFGIKIPAYAMRVAVKDLKEGDIVINGNDTSFFKKATDNGYEVVALNGEVKQVGNVSNLFFGKNSVLAVKNVFGEGTNPMMMAMLFSEGKDFDMKTFALMSMMGGGFDGSNGMLMALALSK
jgi:hypothetical protein